MKILLTGFSGYVGNIIKVNLEKKYNLICLSSCCLSKGNQVQCDLRNEDAVMRIADKISPEVIIHVAGNKNIGYCEKYPEDAFKTNCDSVKNLISAFGRNKSKIIYISTDYVFDGKKGQYKENDEPSPVTVYGKSKLCGEIEGLKDSEDNFVVIRSSALYDLNSTFIRFIHNKLSNNELIECYYDTIYSPTYYKDFLCVLEEIILNKYIKEKLFHVCGKPISRYDFALIFAKIFGFNSKMIIKSSCKGKETFLFPDLSMDSKVTQKILKNKTTKVEKSLSEIKREFIKCNI